MKSCRDDHKCPSVALMFQVGESATYHNVCTVESKIFSLSFLFLVINLKCVDLFLTRWVAAKSHLIHATPRIAVATKSTSCTSPLEILFQEDCMVAIPLMKRAKKIGNVNSISLLVSGPLSPKSSAKGYCSFQFVFQQFWSGWYVFLESTLSKHRWYWFFRYEIHLYSYTL